MKTHRVRFTACVGLAFICLAPRAFAQGSGGGRGVSRREDVWATPREETEAEQQAREKMDALVWKTYGPAMLLFQQNGARPQFLATCKKILATYPRSFYAPQLRSLIAPLEREIAVAVPQSVRKAATARTPEENIQALIFQMREIAGQPGGGEGMFHAVVSFEKPTPVDELVAIGTPAIPFLIAALEDAAPTRAIVWRRSWEPYQSLLRRQDLAMHCLERIVGCQFYDEASTSIYLHSDTPARRKSAIDNVRAWWRISRNVSQAQMIRNQLALRDRNITLRGYDKIQAYEMLAMLEGPQSVIAPMRQMLATDYRDLNSSVVEAMTRIDPQSPVRAAFARFKEHRSGGSDGPILLRYGTRETYFEMARRFEATGKMEPGGWALSDQMEQAARYGKNWAIPLLARALVETEMTGSRLLQNMKTSQPFGAADVALEELQKLSGHDFGYKPEAGVALRLAAIKKARQWWLKGGRAALNKTIHADHAPLAAVGDLMWSDAQIAKRVAALQNPTTRRKSLAAMNEIYSYRVQQALLALLPKEPDAALRLQMLQKLRSHPALWQVPQLAEVLEKDSDEACRVFAGQIIAGEMKSKGTMLWWNRLESRDAGLDAARRLVRDNQTSPAVRETARNILRAWGSFVDSPFFA